MNYYEWAEGKRQQPELPTVPQSLPFYCDPMVMRVRAAITAHQTGIRVEESAGTHTLGPSVPGARLQFLLNTSRPDAIPREQEGRRFYAGLFTSQTPPQPERKPYSWYTDP